MTTLKLKQKLWQNSKTRIVSKLKKMVQKKIKMIILTKLTDSSPEKTQSLTKSLLLRTT